MDIQNFLDPMGGSGRDPIANGSMGIVGFLLEPAFGIYKNQLMHREGKAVKNIYAYKKSLPINSVPLSKINPDLHGPGSIEPELLKAEKTYLMKESRTLLSGRLKTLNKSLLNTKKLVGGLGWAFTASWLFDMGQEAATPGISKSTEMSNQEVIMNESPLDSGKAFTQRQRAMQAIYDSQMTVGRSMIGQEASFLHR